MPSHSPFTTKFALWAFVLILVALSLLLAYTYQTFRATENARAGLESELASTKATLAEATRKLGEADGKLTQLTEAFALSEENGTELLKNLTEEKERNEEFEDRIDKITGTVGKLDKLSKLDPELLMKYSKVYFLNEHYVPGTVKEIPAEFRFKTAEKEYIDAQVAPFLLKLLREAKEDGVDILVASGYRSFDEQKGLKSTYTVYYGSGANAFSADQGYSEHQLGTTVDFTTAAMNGSLVTGFEVTPAFVWLAKNAHEYGFVLSYPKSNAYYMYEPWHWRFVGEKLADDLHDDGKYFYDLEQRDIDKYLISIFD